jgi:hypothetical protein
MAMNLGGWSRVQVPGFFQLAGAINRLAPFAPWDLAGVEGAGGMRGRPRVRLFNSPVQRYDHPLFPDPPKRL